MRIRRLIIDNINSLAGKWEIDFTHPELCKQGLFTITGPTGAGKSTILDCICLALYGATPRYPSGGSSLGEVVSHGQSAGSTELVYSLDDGSIYSSSWSLRRCKGNGELFANGPKIEMTLKLAEGYGWRELPIKLADVKKKNIELTGLEFGQFTQAILLAQGQFRKFFEANSDERAELLAEITDSKLYKKLPGLVNEKKKALEGECTLLEQRLGSISGLLNETEEAEIRQELEQSQVNVQEQQKQKKALEGQLQLWLEYERLTRELANSEADRRTAVEALEAFEALQGERLSQGERAAMLGGTYKDYCDSKKNWQSAREALEKQQAELDETRLKLDVVREEQRQAETAAFLWQKAKTNSEPLWNDLLTKSGELSSLEQACRDKNSESERLKKQTDNLEVNLGVLRQNLQKGQEQLKERIVQLWQDLLTGQSLGQSSMKALEKELNSVHRRLESCYSRLQQLKSLKEQLLKGQTQEDWEERQKTEEDSVRSWEWASRELSGLQIGSVVEEIARLNMEASKLHGMLASSREHVMALETERDEVNERFERARDIFKLVEYRIKLTEGEPCPLCGSLQHPRLESGLSSEQEAAEQEKLRTIKSECEAKLKAEELQLNKFEGDLKVNKTNQEHAKKALDQILGRLEETLKELQDRNLAEKVEGVAVSSPILTLIEVLSLGCPTNLFGEFELTSLVELDKQVKALDKAAAELAEQSGKRARTFQAQLEELKILEKNIIKAGNEQHECELCLAELNRQKIMIGGICQEFVSLRQNWQESAYFTFTELIDENLVEVEPVSFENLKKRLEAVKEEGRVIQIQIKKNEAGQAQIREKEAVLEVSKKQQLVCVTEAHEKQKQLDECSKCTKEILANFASLWRQAAAKVVIASPASGEGTDYLSTVPTWGNRGAYYKMAMRTCQAAQEILEGKNRECSSLQIGLVEKEKYAEQLKGEIQSREEAYGQAEKALETGIEGGNFADLEDFLAKRLEEAELQQLRDDKQRLEEAYRAKKVRCEELGRGISNMQVKLPNCSLQELEQDLGRLEEAVGAENQKIGRLESSLKCHAEALKKHDELLPQYQAKKEAEKRWKLLLNLLGTIDGDTFNKFVQKLAFKNLIAEANKYLEKLSDRYQLTTRCSEMRRTSAQTSDKEALSFNVIDSYQAAVRDSHNLSGGESFLVSLAMALALSEIASRRRSIDSLFLDEGFGTLDAETLDTVLNALTALKNQNKLIGVVSHVAELKEHIPLHIELTRHSDGTSTVKGPGVRRLRTADGALSNEQVEKGQPSKGRLSKK